MRMFVLMTFLAAGSFAADGVCNNNTIKGTYGYAVSGTVPTGEPANPFGPGVSVGIRHFDGEGNFTQVDTSKTTTVSAPDVEASGTYTVNPDCTGVMILNRPGAPAPAMLRMVVVNKGKTIYWLVLSPPTVVVLGTATRI